MGIKREVYYLSKRLAAIENLLIDKRILQAGEMESYSQDIMKKEAEQRAARRKDWANSLWESIRVGDTVENRFTKWEGIVLSKSSEPWRSLTVHTPKRGIFKLKRGHEYTITDITPSDLTIRHKETL